MTFRIPDSKPKHHTAQHCVQPLGNDELERLETDARGRGFVHAEMQHSRQPIAWRSVWRMPVVLE